MDRQHPTSLLRDWVSFRSGGMSIDVPDGNYTVAMFLTDPGYWEYYQNFARRAIVMEGRTMYDTRGVGLGELCSFHCDVECLVGHGRAARNKP